MAKNKVSRKGRLYMACMSGQIIADLMEVCKDDGTFSFKQFKAAWEARNMGNFYASRMDVMLNNLAYQGHIERTSTYTWKINENAQEQVLDWQENAV